MAGVPADAPVRAQRRKKLFWFFHLTTTGIGLGGLFAPVIGLAIVGSVFESPAIQQVTRVPLDILMFATIYTGWLHHQLRPWCPYCRDWDEDGNPEPAPDPSEFTTKIGR